MFNTLAAKLAIVHIAYLSLVAVLACATLMVLNHQEDRQLALSLSERQSMLTQRMTQQLMGYATMADRGEDAGAQREAAVSSMQVFENTLHALEKGGLAPLDLQLVHLQDIPATSEEVGVQLRQIRESYVPLRAQGRAILNGSKESRQEAVAFLIKNNSELLGEVEAATNMLRVELGRRALLMGTIQKTGMIWGLIMTLALLFLARKLFIAPLIQLNEATTKMSRGDIFQPIAVEGPDEFRELGSSFERLRVAMRNFLGASASGSSL
jgi:nitrate/nitrite-specific signal transduction histidine kinase